MTIYVQYVFFHQSVQSQSALMEAMLSAINCKYKCTQNFKTLRKEGEPLILYESELTRLSHPQNKDTPTEYPIPIWSHLISCIYLCPKFHDHTGSLLPRINKIYIQNLVLHILTSHRVHFIRWKYYHQNRFPKPSLSNRDNLKVHVLTTSFAYKIITAHVQLSFHSEAWTSHSRVKLVRLESQADPLLSQIYFSYPKIDNKIVVFIN